MYRQKPTTKTKSADALRLLDEAWSYFNPGPPTRLTEEEPGLFQYYNSL